MAQYCRYCNNCTYGDQPYCSVKDETMTEKQMKRTNKCKYFELNPMDAEPGRGTYKPREKKENVKDLQGDLFEKEVE